MDSLPEQHINSLPKEAREGAYRQIGMVCAFRMREFSEDEVARKAKFSSVEDMYFRLKRWGLPGLLPLEEESEKTSKTTPERKARNSGQVIELPSAGNAATLFREKLEELLHATEDLKHRKESRQGKHYPYRTVSRNSPSDEEWDFFAKLLGLDSVPKDNLYFGGGVI